MPQYINYIARVLEKYYDDEKEIPIIRLIIVYTGDVEKWGLYYGKFKSVDPMKKKKIATKIKPVREDVYDEEHNLIEKCNLI